MTRRQSRGAAMTKALVVLVLVSLLGTGYWFLNKGKAGLFDRGSAFDLAQHLPAESRVAVMFKLSGQLDPEEIRGDVEEVLSKLSAEDREKLSADAPPMELFDGRAAFAALDTPQPGAIALIGLRDAAGFEAYLAKQAPASGKPETLEGISFYLMPEGPYYGHDANWLYLANSLESAAVAVKSAAASQGLDQVTAFIEAKGRVKADRSLAGVYIDIPGLLKTAETLKPSGTDEGTFRGLASLGYLVANYDLRQREGQGFLKVTPDDSQLAQKLLSKGGVSRVTLQGLGKELNFCQALDAEWTFNTVVALMTLSPDTRQQAALASVGLLAVGNPWTAFEGEIAVGSDLLERSTSTFTSNFGSARQQGQTSACQSNLRNVGTALEMYSTDWSGRYPATVGQLTPNYLKTIPSCPSAGSDTYSKSYQQEGEDDFIVACLGNHHGADNLPSYSRSRGLTAAPPTEPADPAEDVEPSFVVAAPVRDISLAHRLLAKALPEVGAEPKVGEEKVYPVPLLDLKMKTDPPARLVLNYGPGGKALADLSQGSIADRAEVKKILDWGGDGLVQLDFIDLQPLLEQVKRAVPKEEEGAEAVLTACEKLEKFGLRGASGIAAREDGLEYRSHGVSSGPVVALGAAILVPNFIRARSGGQMTACKSNLKNIGTALEMWSTDNNGDYPPSMAVLSPNYLRAIPSCPAAGQDTYSASYSLRKGSGDYQIFEVFCSGAHHTEVSLPPDYPRYNGEVGLIERP